MNRRIFTLVGIYIAVILLFAFLRPEKTDWTPSFSPEATIPFAAQVLFLELGTVRQEIIETTDRPIYNSIPTLKEYGRSVYFLLNNRFNPSHLDAGSLMEFVSDGNTVFISSTFISSTLLDTLGVEIEYTYVGSENVNEWFYEDNIRLTLEHQSEQKWNAAVSAGYWWFHSTDSTHTVLGHIESDPSLFADEDEPIRKKPIFIRCPFGEGAFYLHAFPYAFSNYHMLNNNNADYAAYAIGEIPAAEKWIWDTYYANDSGGRAQSPLVALNEYLSFRWAYWLAIAGGCIFIVFTARRRQRMIPVVPPKRNNTLDFIRTIGDLYFHRGDFTDLTEKKISIFQSQLLKKYRLTIVDFTATEATELSSRSGIHNDIVDPLFAKIRYLRSQPAKHIETLLSLQKYLDRFYQRN